MSSLVLRSRFSSPTVYIISEQLLEDFRVAEWVAVLLSLLSSQTSMTTTDDWHYMLYILCKDAFATCKNISQLVCVKLNLLQLYLYVYNTQTTQLVTYVYSCNSKTIITLSKITMIQIT